MTSGPASEVNDWRLRLSSVEIVFICSLTFYSQLLMRAYRLQLIKRESVVVSADQLLSKVNSMPVQTDKTSSQFLDTAGAVPLCRAERGSVLGDTDKVSRHLPSSDGFLSRCKGAGCSRC